MSKAAEPESDLYYLRRYKRGAMPSDCNVSQNAAWWDDEILDYALGYGADNAADQFGVHPLTVAHLLDYQNEIEADYANYSV